MTQRNMIKDRLMASLIFPDKVVMQKRVTLEDISNRLESGKYGVMYRNLVETFNLEVRQ